MAVFSSFNRTPICSEEYGNTSLGTVIRNLVTHRAPPEAISPITLVCQLGLL